MSEKFSGVTVRACFPPGAKPLRGGDGDEAWRVWLDLYLTDMDLAKLSAIARQRVALRVTIEPDESS